MAQAGDFCPDESTMAAGSRISWVAAFGDNTIGETTSFAGQGWGQSTLDVQGVSSSSGTTVVGNTCEPSWSNPLDALRV